MTTPETVLRVKHTVDRLEQPLLCLENLPGEGAELSPANARALAAALLHAARECEELGTQAKHIGPARRAYEVGFRLGFGR